MFKTNFSGHNKNWGNCPGMPFVSAGLGRTVVTKCSLVAFTLVQGKLDILIIYTSFTT